MRMGRGLVHWVREGDQLWLGTDGHTIFALKASAPEVLATDEVKIEEATEKLFRFVDINRLLLRARAAVGPPGNRETRSTVFERNPAVREVARIRSGGRCEMPGCTYVGFEKSDGTLYIEVHHVLSLARAGLDLIENVAAICPNCHAKAHYAKDSVTLEETLLNAVHAANLVKDYITPAAS